MNKKIDLPLFGLVIALFALSLYILLPFSGDVLWAAVIVCTTWPLFLKINKWCKNRRSLAVTFTTLLMILVVVAPLGVGLLLYAQNSHVLIHALRELFSIQTIAVPTWMSDLPFPGESLTQLWQQLVHGGIPGIIDRFESFLSSNSAAVIKQIQGFSDILLHLILTIVVASFFYSIGDRVMATVHDLIRRNLGVEASNCVKVIGDATRSVAFGVVGSAAITACVVAIGLSIAGIPHALALSSAAFASALLMIGPLLILIPVIIWVIFQGSIGWSIFIIAWTLFTVFFDEWITAALIKGGTKMPGVMTFFGIMGGVTCFGVIGVFLGPVILETTYVVSSILIKKNLQPDANT